MRIGLNIFLFVLGLAFFFQSCKSTLNTTLHKVPNPPNNKSENVVFYIAHQDDDIFISSKISEHLKLGDEVKVVYTCLSYQRGEKYKEKRVNEAEKALSYLKVPLSNVHYLGYPDMESHKHLDKLIHSTDSLFKLIKPDVVYTSAYEGGNIDHDVANYTISHLIYKQGYSFEAYEFPEYSGYKTCYKFKYRNFPVEQKTYIEKLSKEEYKKVINHWDFYKSQKFPINILMAVTDGKKNIFGYEYYRPLPLYDYSQKPPSGEVAYEKYLDATFDEFIFETQAIPTVQKKRNSSIEPYPASFDMGKGPHSPSK